MNETAGSGEGGGIGQGAGPKHFNKGVVWGIVREHERKSTQGGTGYMNVKVDCSGGMFGPSQVFGRLYGEKEISKLEGILSADDRAVVRLEGLFGQYVGDGDTLRSTYTFFNAAEAPEHMPRAAFVLVGEVEEVSTEESGERLVRFKIRRENQDPEPFILRLEKKHVQFHPHIVPGNTLELKGVVERQEDLYGGTGQQHPYIKASAVRELEAARF